MGRHRYRQFKDEAQEQAFREITSQLRCPKCQNNSIADSNAMIAADMRQKVYELMQQGKRKGRSLTIWWPATVICQLRAAADRGHGAAVAGAGAVRAGGRGSDYRPRAPSRHS